MKCYALGALASYDSLYDIEEVSMSIFQPRRENVSTWTITVSKLKTWAEEVKDLFHAMTVMKCRNTQMHMWTLS